MRTTKPIIEFDYFGQNIYLLMVAIGVFFGLIVLLKNTKKEKVSTGEESRIILTFVLSLIIGVIFSNVTNWFFMPELMEYKLFQRFQNAGFNFYSGLLFFLGSAFVLMKFLKINTKLWMNYVIPSILVFHGFGRIGCSLAGCCYGIELFEYPVVKHTHLELFPAREIEALSLFVMFFIFTYKVKKNRVPIYLVSYSIIRFTLELFRDDYRGNFRIPFFSPAQVISMLVVLSVLCWLVCQTIRAKKQKSSN